MTQYNDHYDNFDSSANTDSMMIALKSIMHDLYVKDLSTKIKATLDLKKEKGILLGSPPYGYVRSEDGSGQLVVDEETGEIVKQIFEWKKSGMTIGEIAKLLNRNKILSRANYLYKKGFSKKPQYSKPISWLPESVAGVLRNVVYTGTVSQRKSSLQYKGIGQEAEGIIVENAHEPLVTHSVFEEVQLSLEHNKIKRDSGKIKTECDMNFEHIFKDLLFCYICGRNLRRNTNKASKTITYHCRHCSELAEQTKDLRYLNDKTLRSVVKVVLQNHIKIVGNFEKVILHYCASPEAKQQTIQLKECIRKHKDRISKIHSLLESVYEDFTEQILSEADYSSTKKYLLEEKEERLVSIQQLSEQIHFFEGTKVKENSWSKIHNQYSNMLELDRTLLLQMVERIEFDSKKELIITLKYRDQYKELQNLAETYGGDE